VKAHQKTKDIPALAAAKAVKNLLFLVDRKEGVFSW